LLLDVRPLLESLQGFTEQVIIDYVQPLTAFALSIVAAFMLSP